MKSIKSQASTEFLMMFGFALLAVLAAVAAFAYFGVIGGDERGLSEKCWFSIGLDCIDRAAINTTEINFALKNNLGGTLTVSDVSMACPITDRKIAVGNANTNYSALPVVIPNEEIAKVKITCNFNKKERVKELVTITYTKQDTGLTNKVQGEIVGRVI